MKMANLSTAQIMPTSLVCTFNVASSNKGEKVQLDGDKLLQLEVLQLIESDMQLVPGAKMTFADTLVMGRFQADGSTLWQVGTQKQLWSHEKQYLIKLLDIHTAGSETDVAKLETVDNIIQGSQSQGNATSGATEDETISVSLQVSGLSQESVEISLDKDATEANVTTGAKVTETKISHEIGTDASEAVQNCNPIVNTLKLLDIKAMKSTASGRKKLLWSELTSNPLNRPVTDLRVALTDICNCLSSDFDMLSVPDSFFPTAFETEVPLVAIGKKLLPMALHYQLWDEMLRKWNRCRVKLSGGLLDWKTVFLALRFYLHPVKATLLCEKFAEMCRPIPFLADMSATGVCEKPQIFLRNFRNLFDTTGGHQFLLSVGWGSVKGKSKFLNKVFDCQFEVNSAGPFHDQSIDAAVSTKGFPLSFHILDYHGVADWDLVANLSTISTVTMVHANDKEVEGNPAALVEVLKKIDKTTAIVVMLRQLCDGFDTVGDVEILAIEGLLKELSSRQLRVIYVPFLADGEDFETQFHSLIEDVLRPTLKELFRSPKVFKIYRQLEHDLLHNVTSAEVIVRSDTCVELENKMRQQVDCFRSLESNQDAQTRNMFQRSEWNTTLTKLEEQLKRLRAGSAAEQGQAETDIRLAIEQIQKQLDGTYDSYGLLQTFIEILRTKDVEQYEEFMAQIRLETQFSIEQFWQEALLTAKCTKKLQPIVVAAGKLMLSWGYPYEVLNGESLTIANFDCLKDMLTEKRQRDSNVVSTGTLLCSVIGPQSSAKSTLVNRLFGSSFAMGAGRCTKGMHMSLFDARAMNIDGLRNVLVLDTEGLMSAVARNVGFDHQMTLMALALSHVILINVKGEMGEPIKEVLKVTLLALKQLAIHHASPKLLFILRDMIDLDPNKQSETIANIQSDMAAICAKIEFHQVDIITKDSFILLPSAINQVSKNNQFFTASAFVPNTKFSSESYKLLLRICQFVPPQIKPGGNIELPFSNLPEWLSHFNATWMSVRQSGQMMHYKCLQEYFDRKYLSDVTTKVCSKLTADFKAEAKTGAEEVLKSPADALLSAKTQFTTQHLSNLADKYREAAGKHFDSLLEDRHDLGALKYEYRQSLNENCRILRDQAEKDFELQQAGLQAKQLCRMSIAKIKEWIDRESNQGANALSQAVVAGQFETFWMSERGVLEKKLRSTLPNEVENWQTVNTIFGAVAKMHPVSQRYDVSACSEEFTQRFTKLLNSHVEEDIKSYVEPCTVRSSLTWWVKYPKLWTQFKEIVYGMKEYIGAAVSKLDSSEGVRQVVEQLYLRLNVTSDRLVERNGCRFKVDFYSVCLSFLFCSINQQIRLVGEKKVEAIMSEFDKNKLALMQTYTQLVYNRFDDKQTVQNLADLVIKNLVYIANTKAVSALGDNVQLKASLTAERLVAVAEQRQASEDIFLYITDFPKFLTNLFGEFYDRELADLRPRYDARLNLLCMEDLESFRKGIDSYKSAADAAHIGDIEVSRASNDIAREFNRWSFSCFKAHLSQQPLPALTAVISDSKIQQFAECLVASPFTYNLQQLLETVPDSFAICDTSKFCNDLQIVLVDKLSQSNVCLQLNEGGSLKLIKERLLNKAIGCFKTCPLCKAKCTNINDGHTTHSTESHRIVAFSGHHTRGTRNFSFYICTSLYSRERRYFTDKNSDVAISFEDLMRPHNWSVALDDNARVENRNIFRWLKVRRRLCEYYDLDDNTPTDWLKMEEAAAKDGYDNSRKGLAMIINVEDFDDSRVRHGSDKDFHSSQDLWQNKLGYKVESHSNLTAKEIDIAMEQFAKNPGHKDSAIVVVMSHGNLEQIEGSDGVGVNIEGFVNTLCNSTLLKGKPKLFIFQACRGTETVLPSPHDGAKAKEVKITEEIIQSSLAWFKQSKSLHDGVEDVKHADSLLAFATTRGHPACRRGDGTGSYYIQEICKVFASQFETVHVAKMLETVELNVSKMPILLATGLFEQVGTNINNLRRPLYL